METFDLEAHEYIALNDLLKVEGLCASGGIAKSAIADGLVKVNGKVELRKRCKIRSGQIVEFSEHKIIIN